MNYINLINQFWEVNERHCFGSSEIAFYFHLLKECNSKNWENPFTHHNIKVTASIGLSEKTIKKSKDKLVSAGLLNYKSGKNKREYTVYRLVEKITTNLTTKTTTNPTTNEGANTTNVYINENKNINFIHIKNERVCENEIVDWFNKNFPLMKNNWQPIFPLANVDECLIEFIKKRSFESFKDNNHFKNAFAFILRDNQNKNSKEKSSAKKESGSKVEDLLEQDRKLKEMNQA